MAERHGAYILDSWSVIAFFSDEPEGERVEQLIADAGENATPLWMNLVNVGEVWYVIARKMNEQEADKSIAELRSLGIHVDIPDWQLTRQAALFKSKNKLSLADAFAAALAKQKHAVLVTGDPEFKPLEKEIEILWLAPKPKKRK